MPTFSLWELCHNYCHCHFKVSERISLANNMQVYHNTQMLESKNMSHCHLFLKKWQYFSKHVHTLDVTFKCK